MSTALYEIFGHPSLMSDDDSSSFSIEESDIFWRKIGEKDKAKKKFFNKPTLLKFCKKYGIINLYKICRIESISEKAILESFIDSDREYSTLPQILRNKLFLMIKAKG